MDSRDVSRLHARISGRGAWSAAAWSILRCEPLAESAGQLRDHTGREVLLAAHKDAMAIEHGLIAAGIALEHW